MFDLVWSDAFKMSYSNITNRHDGLKIHHPSFDGDVKGQRLEPPNR